MATSSTLKPYPPIVLNLRRPLPFAPSPLFKPPSITTTAVCRSSKWADRLLPDFHFLPPTTLPPLSPTLLSPPSTAATTTISLPIDYYLVLAAEPHFLADGIRRAFDAKSSRPPQHGFSQDALAARRQILHAACDVLSDPDARREYNRCLADDKDSALATAVPLDKVAGALCLLQEAGEAGVVLRAGRVLLRERLPKTVKQDVVLAMGLAYVDVSREAMTLSPPNLIECCEVLERALKLLQEEGASNLAPDLQAQIDETLEEITPHCVLELLALPLDEEHRVKREEGLVRVRNILWSVGGGGAAAVGGGFTREDFMNEAFSRMTSAEQVELFVAKPSNIPRESFEVYNAALAMVAQAFVAKKPHLIKNADNLFLQLQHARVVPLGAVSDSTEGADCEIVFTLERGLCSLLLGDLDECCSWLGIDSERSPYRDPSIIEFVMENSNLDGENYPLPGFCKLLETWLMKTVFPKFRDTRNVHFRLRDYYDDPTVLKYLERMGGDGGYPLAAAAAIVKIGAKTTLGNVKSSVLQALQKVFPSGNKRQKAISDGHDITKENTANTYQYDSGGDAEALENPVSADSNGQGFTKKLIDWSGMIVCGGAIVGLSTLVGIKYLHGRSGLPAATKELCSAMAADVVKLDDHVDEIPSDQRLLQEMPKMDAKLAEDLVRKWQKIKSQALGPDHCLAELPAVLEGQMLKMWTDRAAEIARHGWFWEYTLMGVTIDSITVSSDGRRAMVEVTIEEAAQLTYTTDSEHKDSSSTKYSAKYALAFSKSGWRITEGAVLQP